MYAKVHLECVSHNISSTGAVSYLLSFARDSQREQNRERERAADLTGSL